MYITYLSLQVSCRHSEVIELLRSSTAHHILLTGAQGHAQYVVRHRVSPCRCHVIRIGVDPDAHCPGLAIDVLVVSFFKDVQCSTAPGADETLGVGGDAVHTHLLLFLLVHHTDTGMRSARNRAA